MNRRSFFKFLGITGAVAITAPKILLSKASTENLMVYQDRLFVNSIVPKGPLYYSNMNHISALKEIYSNGVYMKDLVYKENPLRKLVKK